MEGEKHEVIAKITLPMDSKIRVNLRPNLKELRLLQTEKLVIQIE